MNGLHAPDVVLECISCKCHRIMFVAQMECLANGILCVQVYSSDNSKKKPTKVSRTMKQTITQYAYNDIIAQ